MIQRTYTKNRGLWVHPGCEECQYQKVCMGVSWLGRWRPRAWVLARNLLIKVKSSKKQAEGTTHHMELEIKRGVERPNAKEVCERIKAGEKVLFTQAFCSRLYGLYCHPDAIEVQVKDDTAHILLIEDKATYRGENWLQLLGEGLILSDPNCLIDGLPFYELIGSPLKVNIVTKMVPYYNEKYALVKDFVKDGAFINVGLKYAVLKRRNQYRDLIHVTNWEAMPLCPSCKEDVEWCGYWPLCCKFLPQPTKQAKFGKRGKLIGVSKRRKKK